MSHTQALLLIVVASFCFGLALGSALFGGFSTLSERRTVSGGFALLAAILFAIATLSSRII